MATTFLKPAKDITQYQPISCQLAISGILATRQPHTLPSKGHGLHTCVLWLIITSNMSESVYDMNVTGYPNNWKQGPEKIACNKKNNKKVWKYACKPI